MTPKIFISELRALSFPNTFNPYSERCGTFDVSDAPEQRSRTLLALLQAACAREVDAIWIGRDLGYRGGRRTGLALTDEVHSKEHAERWGAMCTRPTIGEPVAERTASVIWQLLRRIEVPIFLWNVFPLHPHLADNPFTNRTHNAIERAAGQDVLAELVKMIKPRRIIAIGNDAEMACQAFSGQMEVKKVRHPSYGGQTQFIREIREAYHLPEPQSPSYQHHLQLA